MSDRRHLQIAPSILTSDFTRLGETLEMLNSSQCDYIHLDVMDGVFVPNISFGFPVIRNIAKKAAKPLDVHLMIVDPDRYIGVLRDAAPEYVTVHYEACTHLHRSLQNIRANGMKAGVVLNPHTPVSSLEYIAEFCDMVVLMSVNPGFGGQSFIESTYRKVAETKETAAPHRLARPHRDRRRRQPDQRRSTPRCRSRCGGHRERRVRVRGSDCDSRTVQVPVAGPTARTLFP